MIFNGIEIMFYLLGIFTTLGVFIMIYYSKKYILKWFSWVLGISAIFVTLFTIAWSWSSILEKEPQAAGMGLLTFGLPALILIFVTRKMILKSEKQSD
jgi:presenilin-like A22 family membrane protease